VDGHLTISRFVDDSFQGVRVFDTGYLNAKVGTVRETRVTGRWRRGEFTDVS
jgi:hypothetical protein